MLPFSDSGVLRRRPAKPSRREAIYVNQSPDRFCSRTQGQWPADFDTLTLVGRSLFAVCRRLSHSGRVVPGVMSRSTEAAEGGTRDEVSLDVEDVVNGGVGGDEALG